MTQPNANPIKWAREETQKPEFGGITPHERNVCRQLQEIFVRRMGIANAIDLQICPTTGERILNVNVSEESPMLRQWICPNVYGIAVRVSVEPC